MNSFDLFISSFINGFAHRSIRFDQFVNWLSLSDLFKGVVVIAVGCWLWFQNEDIQETREALLASIMASFPALAIARVLSWVVNRTRPLMETRHLFRLPYGQTPRWEGPSSFPSDHALPSTCGVRSDLDCSHQEETVVGTRRRARSRPLRQSPLLHAAQGRSDGMQECALPQTL